MATATPMTTGDVPPVESDFQDLDQVDVLAASLHRVKDPGTANFVVQFDEHEAEVRFNIEATEWKTFLQAQRPDRKQTRWINIFAPYHQKDAVRAIGYHYGLSKRLLELMSSDQYTPPRQPAPTPISQYSYVKQKLRRSEDVRTSHLSVDLTPDLEKQSSGLDTPESPKLEEDLSELNYYQLVNEVWHFAAVDKGKRYLCLGFNTLHSVLDPDASKLVEENKPSGMPRGKRLWSWLVLCDDGTVVSVYEDPLSRPSLAHKLSREQTNVLLTCRRNIINVFRHLSKEQLTRVKPNPLFVLQLRRGLEFLDNNGGPDLAESFVAENGSSLLFYYLFDDWHSTYGLVARKEQQYGSLLSNLRKEMVEQAQLEYINHLHDMGRQLAVLKRMYESYKNVLDRILEGQRLEAQKMQVMANPGVPPFSLTARSLADSTPFLSPNEPDMASSIFGAFAPPPPPLTSPGIQPRSPFGPIITSEATARFERLRDRIKLYVLSEIQDCLDEKESMALMNFNLIAMKESQAVEHLTRITILLAKLTIIFLPVSLMTAYFSTQIEELHFTKRAYWTSFGVIMGLSLFFIIVFGIISGTMESKIIYEPLSRRFVNASKRALGRGRTAKGDFKSS